MMTAAPPGLDFSGLDDGEFELDGPQTSSQPGAQMIVHTMGSRSVRVRQSCPMPLNFELV